MIYAVHTSEIRDSTLCRYPRPAKEHNIITAFYHFFQLFYSSHFSHTNHQTFLPLLICNIHINRALNTVYCAFFRILPHTDLIRKIHVLIIKGIPFLILLQLRHIQHLGKALDIAINHRRISCCLYCFAKGNRNVCALLHGQIVGSSVLSRNHLHIKYNRIRYIISSQILNYKSCFFLRFFHCNCLCKEIHASLNTSFICSLHIIGKVLIQYYFTGRGLDYNQVKGFKETQKVTEDARAQFYFAVDQPFRQWLQEIDPEQDDPDEAVQRWEAQARRIAEELGAKMVREAGNAALKGHRVVVDKGKKTERSTLYTSPKAYNTFRSKLWNIYPKAEP